jgi:uncharacterized SAM-dependent methyltransferase
MLASILKQAAHIESYTFSKRVIDLFLGNSNANLQDDLYSEPIFDGDAVNGSGLLKILYGSCADYYLQRCENVLVKTSALSIAKVFGRNVAFIDYGPGPVESVINKTLPILSHLTAPKAYIPVDICHQYLVQLREYFSINFPGLNINPVCDTYYNPELNFSMLESPIVYFSGSSLFNCPGSSKRDFDKEIIVRLGIIKKQLGGNGRFLVSQDTCQDETMLIKAYGNAIMGNLITNTLKLILRDTENRNFNPNIFKYYAAWDQQEHNVELGVESTQAQSFYLGDQKISVPKFKRYGITNSVKYPADKFLEVCHSAGFKHSRTWKLPENPIQLHMFSTN